MSATTSAPSRAPRTLSGWRLVFDLFKLRIGVAIGATALAGLAIAPGDISVWRAVAIVLAVTLASAAAGAFNQYVERDLDRSMRRTRHRAFVTGRLAAGPFWPLVIGAVAASGVALAWVATNGLAALYTALGAFTYGVVYTVWLKRRTAWNIVIGGLAGSFAVLAGAAAVAPGAPDPTTLAFAVILFLWTPPHFWSLAIAYRDDYAAARVPMLPVVAGDRAAARAVFSGAAMLVIASVVPGFLGMSWFYAACALAGGMLLLVRAGQLALEPTRQRALASFHASLVQLSLLIVAACADPLFRA
ncbi:MAG TPA: heme o synthase [Casimicrobiaceae bacterium]|nr:heme o synthase [Casimicrobiaceae bacterium]